VFGQTAICYLDRRICRLNSPLGGAAEY